QGLEGILGSFSEDIEFIGAKEAAETSIKDIPDIEKYTLIYLEDNIFDPAAYEADALYDLSPVRIADNENDYLTVPGEVQYLTDDFQFVDYNRLEDVTTLKVLSPGTVCVMTRLGMPLMWKITIAVLILVVFAVILPLVLSKLRKRSRGAIIGIAGEYKGAKFKMKDGEEVIIGRDPGLANVVLMSGSGLISRKHCGVRYDRQKNIYWITDYSTKGTYTKNGERIKVNQQNGLRGGNVICLGNNENMFKLQ
ncbi:MAG: FHA domain-containing protein, partial [Eubacteriales bacterium]|nr:FHA domain-containing protein [Eubacteriales bacterium]